jgi:integrase
MVCALTGSSIRLTIRDTKPGEQQHVYLNELAASVLRSLDKVLGNPYIIAGAAPMKPLQTYAKAWKRVLTHAEVPYFKPHGLRHNYVSMLVAAGEPMDVIGHLVGHKNAATTKKYAHHRPDGLRKTTERFGQVIEMKVKNEQT